MGPFFTVLCIWLGTLLDLLPFVTQYQPSVSTIKEA